MAVGQAALRGTLDVSALNAIETSLEVAGVARCFQHAQLLREVLALHRLHLQADMVLATVPQVALLLQLSESAARDRLAEAQLLLSLPGGLEALECGLLTVEQSAAVLRSLGDLSLRVRLAVWQRLQARLLAALDEGTPLPGHEVGRLLRSWVIAADPAGAQERRRAAEAAGDVSYRRREDGLGDLFATGMSAPLLQAVLCRIREASRPWGSDDERSAGKRRLDALVDLVLGRDALPSALDVCDSTTDTPEDDTRRDGRRGRACGPRCGCRLDAPAPCGVDVLVHVPLGAALGITDELGELVGHGPLDPEQLAQILSAGPRLRAVHVDAHGVPVSVGDAVHLLPRDDPAALRTALLNLAATPPRPAQPQHPHDHQPPAHARPRPRGGPAVPAQPRQEPFSTGEPHAPRPPGETHPPRPPGQQHAPRPPGPYRPPRWLRRLVESRSPRCEWPGCGVRAQFCDFEHDQAWPTGPTCACNTGPLCRHHHRVKQLHLFRKTRGAQSAVSWTDPTGRTWTGAGQHDAPAAVVRPLPAVPPAETHSLSPQALAELFARPDTDPVRYELRAPDVDVDSPDHDLLADRLDGDTRWGLDLDDPYAWAS